MTVNRSDPRNISSTLKEAVVDSILNLTYSQVSGQGISGSELFGAKPTALLNSGFLLPQRNPQGDDEVTSPIWISSHGLQMQLSDTSNSVITIAPNFSIYIRVIPTKKDLERPNCRPVFMLSQAVKDSIISERNARLDAAWESMKGKFKQRWKHPDWRETQKNIVDQVYQDKGIPRNLLTAHFFNNSSDLPEDITNLEGETDDSTNEGINVEDIQSASIRDADFEPLAVPHKWQRIDICVPPLVLDTAKHSNELQNDIVNHSNEMTQSIAQQIRSWAEDDDSVRGGKAWVYRRGIDVPASQYQNWDAFLRTISESNLDQTLPNIELGWDIQITRDWLEPTKRNLFIALENRSTIPGRFQDETEEAIFQVNLQVTMPSELHHPLKLERVDPSYRYNEYLNYPAMGHNGGVNHLDSPAGTVLLQTTWTPRYLQPRIVPTSANGVIREIRKLADAEGFAYLAPLVPAMQNWIDNLPNQIDCTAGLDSNDLEGAARENGAFQQDLNKWLKEKESIAAGLECLSFSKTYWSGRGPQKDARGIPFEAWLAMNETMADFMRERFGNDNSEWRLFQLAFIIASVPSIISRMNKFQSFYQEQRDDAVTLLYFATGGGKSEAFFGLLVFNLLFDRLRGKLRGVTALLRYPLRLLTIQQAQRCARVMAFAERIRLEHAYPGSELSIGFWVGSGGSPNYHKTKGVSNIPTVLEAPPSLELELELREADSKYSTSMRAWRKLPSCPFCQKETALRRFLNGGDPTLGHVCTDIQCDSNKGEWRALPFYIVDEDIYDYAPSVLLGTVDKLALIGFSSRTIRRIYGMFGASPWIKENSRLYIPTRQELAAGPNSKGMKGIYPAYKSGEQIFHDPFPSLIIQDEAHLLDESLGTFAGLFESTLDTVFEYLGESLQEIVACDTKGKRRRAKIIAASATVSDPQRQLEHLYQRSIPATQFPEPGPTLYDSFYATPLQAQEDEARKGHGNIEVASEQARIYTAYLTNGKPHTSTSVAILSSFHFVITTLLDELAIDDPQRLDTIRNRLAEHLTEGPLQSLHAEKLRSASGSELATLIDLHRIALTYVTNKKGGDQIMAAEAEETRKRHLNESINLDSLDTRLITGSVEQGEIQAVVSTAQSRVDPGEPLPPLREQLRSVIATSAISHGVDVDEFNSMFFAGMPSDIAEYIQASSRVGRAHIGFVVLIPTPQRRRDRHVVHIFDIFHRFLERMVQPAAIDRWAEKAIERVYPSLLQAYLLGVVPSTEIISRSENEKTDTPDFNRITNIYQAFSSRGDGLIREITAFIEKSLGLIDPFLSDGADHYRQIVENKTRRLIGDVWSEAQYASSSVENYFMRHQTDPMLKPMTSLRDVDQGGVILSSPRDVNGNRQKPADVQLVMDLVRHGVAENDGTYSDETE